MPRPDADQELTPSVLDRLFDTPSEPGARASPRLPEITAWLLRDLEWLLNTRQPIVDLPPGRNPLRSSILTFGLPDLTRESDSGRTDQRALCRMIEERIARFEPRLSNVVVTLLESDPLRRCVDFRIDAVLHVDPLVEPVAVASTLDLVTKSFAVKSA